MLSILNIIILLVLLLVLIWSVILLPKILESSNGPNPPLNFTNWSRMVLSAMVMSVMVSLSESVMVVLLWPLWVLYSMVMIPMLLLLLCFMGWGFVFPWANRMFFLSLISIIISYILTQLETHLVSLVSSISLGSLSICWFSWIIHPSIFVNMVMPVLFGLLNVVLAFVFFLILLGPISR